MSSIIVKVERKSDLRRFRIDEGFQVPELFSTLKQLYGITEEFAVKYLDAESDWITLSTQEDLEEAKAQNEKNLIRLSIKEKSPTNENTTHPSAEQNALHSLLHDESYQADLQELVTKIVNSILEKEAAPIFQNNLAHQPSPLLTASQSLPVSPFVLASAESVGFPMEKSQPIDIQSNATAERQANAESEPEDTSPPKEESPKPSSNPISNFFSGILSPSSNKAKKNEPEKQVSDQDTAISASLIVEEVGEPSSPAKKEEEIGADSEELEDTSGVSLLKEEQAQQAESEQLDQKEDEFVVMPDVEQTLELLKSMGFPDEEKNREMLKKHKGSVEDTVEALISSG